MNYLQKWVVLFYATALTAVGTVGCDVVPIYRPTTGGHFGADISPKSAWTVRGDLAGPAAAIDDNLTTIAHSGYRYAGAELTIDLNKVCLFQTIIIEHGAARTGHCRSIDISTSIDGKTFNKQYVSPGTRRVTIISLPAPTLARYVRIKALKPGAGRWSIAEIYIQ